MSTADLPMIPDAWEAKRWAETRMRRAMLTGTWRQYLTARLQRSLGSERASAIGDADLSSNTFASVCGTLAVSYDIAPIAKHVDAGAAELMNRLLTAAGYAPTMQEVQRLTLGLREMLICVEVIKDTDGDLPAIVALRPVYPDLVIAKPHPTRPFEPIEVTEAQEVEENGACRYIWTTASARQEGGGLTEPTERYDETRAPRAPLVVDSANVPVMPYVMYHATIGTTLWDPFAWQELVEGTLEVGVDRSAYHHSLRMAAYPQRYGIDVQIAGSETKDGRQSVTADPSQILLFERTDPAIQPVLAQFAAAFDPQVFQAAVAQDESRLAAHAGIPVTDLIRGSGDARSGFALLLSREGRKEASRRLEPSFARADARLFCTIAALVNAAVGAGILPDTGWSVSYQALPLTEDERATRDARILAKLDKNMISPVEARMEMEGETREQAIAALDAMPKPPNIKLVGSQDQIRQTVLDVTAGLMQKPVAIALLTRSYGMPIEDAVEIINIIQTASPPAPPAQ